MTNIVKGFAIGAVIGLILRWMFSHWVGVLVIFAAIMTLGTCTQQRKEDALAYAEVHGIEMNFLRFSGLSNDDMWDDKIVVMVYNRSDRAIESFEGECNYEQFFFTNEDRVPANTTTVRSSEYSDFFVHNDTDLYSDELSDTPYISCSFEDIDFE